MSRLAFIAFASALLVAAGAVVQLRAVRAELAAAEARLAGQEEAARFRLKEQQRAASSAAVDRQLQEGAGADVALSDYLRGAAGRVWP